MRQTAHDIGYQCDLLLLKVISIHSTLFEVAKSALAAVPLFVTILGGRPTDFINAAQPVARNGAGDRSGLSVEATEAPLTANLHPIRHCRLQSAYSYSIQSLPS